METTQTDFGVDTLLQNLPTQLKTNRIGLITNNVATNRTLTPSRRALQEAGVNLTSLFSPEHGLAGHHADGAAIANETDSLTELPVHSLYGETLHPTAAMLRDIDLLLFDIPDVGVRFYTYIWTLSHAMEACAEYGVPLWVLDRPNPLGGQLEMVEGPTLDETQVSSFVGRWPIPIRHSLTAGELAQLWNAERNLGVDLTVIPAQGWARHVQAPEVGIPFIPTSPGIPSYITAQVYPGTCLFEGTNLSEGRGTATPFQVVGAPWFDGQLMADAMNQLVVAGVLAGVTFRSHPFAPAASKHAGIDCGGIMLHVTNREDFRPVKGGLYLLAATIHQYPNEFEWLPYPTNAAGAGYGHFDRLIGRLDVREQLGKLSNKPSALTSQIEEWTSANEWADRVRGHLLY